MVSATASLRIPQYRLHKSRGLAKVRLDGRDVYLGKYDSPESHAQYKRVIAEWLGNAKVDSEPTPPGQPKRTISVNELLVAFLDHAKSYYVRDGKVTGEVQNLKYAVTPVARMYGTQPVTEFGPVALKAVRQVMVEQGWCRSLVNSRVNGIRRVFRWGVESELVPSGVLYALRAVPGLKRGRCDVRETEPVKPVPDAIVDSTCKAAVPVIAAMVRLQRLTGMRPGELVIMRTRDLDTTGKVWQYTPSRHKTDHHGQSRLVYLGPLAQRVLRPMLLNDLDAFIFSPARAMRELSTIKRQLRKTRVQPSQLRRDRVAKPRDLGEHYTTCSYGRAIAYAYACDRADVWRGGSTRAR